MLSEEKNQTVLEHIEDGYYEIDLKGNVTFFNEELVYYERAPRASLYLPVTRQRT